MECYMHIFTIPVSENPHLLCLALIFLQWHNCTLPNMHLWLPEQHYSARELCRVSSCSQVNITFCLSLLLSLELNIFIYTLLFNFKFFSILVYREDSPYLASVVSGSGKNSYTPLVQCTKHMCPIRVHWHVKLSYKEYWRVKVTITNFNYRMNYTQWNLVVQHPNFDNLTQIFSFNYKSLTPYAAISKF